MLSDFQRRTLANLSIPRNVDDLTNCLREYTPATTDMVDELLRDDLLKQGWVVKLGTHDDSAKLASHVQGLKKAMELPDEKAEIYSRRMKRRDLQWRLGGDLWMLSEDGLAQLHAEPEGTPPPMTPSQLQATIDAEWQRVHKGKFVPGKTSLAEKLLEDEYTTWLDAVMADAKDRWGEMAKDLHGPLAGGASGWSDAYEVSILDQENQKTAIGAVVDPWFMALSILALTDADTGTTADNGTHIPTYTGYARKSVAGTDMPSATSGAGSAANTSAIIFAACTAGTSTIVAFGNTSASTVGTLRKWGDCSSTVVSTTQTPPQFAVGAYVTTAA